MKAVSERLFDTRLYAADAIEEAMDAFAGLARFSLVARDTDLCVTITAREHVPHDVETLASEFANFALAETIHRNR